MLAALDAIIVGDDYTDAVVPRADDVDADDVDADVMIYWHVERKSVGVYSQLKTCSSSEVAAMMEGLIRHAADIDSKIEANYTDTHGASLVG